MSYSPTCSVGSHAQPQLLEQTQVVNWEEAASRPMEGSPKDKEGVVQRSVLSQKLAHSYNTFNFPSPSNPGLFFQDTGAPKCQAEQVLSASGAQAYPCPRLCSVASQMKESGLSCPCLRPDLCKSEYSLRLAPIPPGQKAALKFIPKKTVGSTNLCSFLFKRLPKGPQQGSRDTPPPREAALT